jgi:penicillin-binding protein 2
MAGSAKKSAGDSKVAFLRIVVVVLFFALLARLFWMQVLKYPVFLKGAISNKIKFIPQIPPRGQIFDRAGRPLAVNEPVFSLMYFPPMKVEQEDAYIPEIARLLGRTPEDVKAKIKKETDRRYPYQPIPIHDNLTLEQVTTFMEIKTRLPGIFVEENNYRRRYPYGAATAHVVGYTGRIDDDNLNDMLDIGFEKEEYIGKDGAEKEFQQILHGKPGGREIEVTDLRYFKREISYKPAKSGSDICLTINADIQQAAYRVLGNRRGTIILSKPATGEIIAMVSSPSYDPNRLHGPQNAEYVNGLITDKTGLPLFFRSIAGKYSPGSIFKIVTAIAGLETGKASENTQWTCNGTYDVGNRSFREHYTPHGHGTVTFKNAIAESCDVAFWQLGVRLGSKQIGKYASILGYGSKLGIDLPGEKAGRVPDREYKLKYWREEWYDGDTANMAIGQGFVEATVLQVLWSVNAIVTDGVVPRPHVLKAVFREGDFKDAVLPPPRDLEISPNTARIVREGMRRAVLYGTCKQLKDVGVSVAGKTGTADVPHGQDPHAWFVGFFPYDHPKYTLVVLIENGGKASDSSVPVAKQFIRRLIDGGFMK